MNKISSRNDQQINCAIILVAHEFFLLLEFNLVHEKVMLANIFKWTNGNFRKRMRIKVCVRVCDNKIKCLLLHIASKLNICVCVDYSSLHKNFMCVRAHAFQRSKNHAHNNCCILCRWYFVELKTECHMRIICWAWMAWWHHVLRIGSSREYEIKSTHRHMRKREDNATFLIITFSDVEFHFFR